MYDLVLKGGRIVDPSAGLDGILDIGVQGQTIARIAPDIPGAEAMRTIEVAGTIVTPGLIDLHAHVFEGFNRTGVHPDLAGVHAGVTTIVDAGSAGAATFAGFPRHIIPHCHTEIIPFLHICQTGLATNPDIIAETSIDLDDTWMGGGYLRETEGRTPIPTRVESQPSFGCCKYTTAFDLARLLTYVHLAAGGRGLPAAPGPARLLPQRAERAGPARDQHRVGLRRQQLERRVLRAARADGAGEAHGDDVERPHARAAERQRADRCQPNRHSVR